MTLRRPNLLVLLAVSLVVGLATGAILGFGDASGMPVSVQTAILGISLILAVGYCSWAFARLDEAAREAHKSAWWWGASGGMVVAALFIPALLQGSDLGLGRIMGDQPGDLVIGGAFAVLLLQVAGYFVAWTAWWLRRR